MALGVSPEIQGPGPAAPRDRCAYPRPFTPDFTACPAYQATTFIAVDSDQRELHTHLTCRHLEIGTDLVQAGRFYPRCALGDPGQRRRWVARVGLERLELVRTLQREFDQFSDPYRDSLYRLRERLVSDPTDWQRRDDLDRKLTQYRRAIASFLEEREPRFRDAGLPVAPLQELLEESLARWSRDRLGRPSQLDATRLRAFSPEAQAFLGSAVDASWKREAAAREVIFDDGMLEVARLNDPPRLALSGEIDASNAESVAEALAGEGRRVDQLSIDLSGVLFCDLAGLRAILGAAARLDGQSTLWLQRVPEQMARVMKLAELTPPPNLVVVPEESPW